MSIVNFYKKNCRIDVSLSKPKITIARNPASNSSFWKMSKKIVLSIFLWPKKQVTWRKVKILNSLHVFMVKDFSLSLATWLYGTARCLKTSWGTKDKSLALLHDHPFTKGGKNKTRACLTQVLQTFVSVKIFFLIPTTSVILPISSVTNCFYLSEYQKKCSC